MSVSHRHFTTLLPALCSGLCRPSCVSAVFRCSPSAHRHFAYLGNWQGLESASRRSLVPAGWCLQRFWRVCLPTRWHSFGIIRATNFSSTGLVPPRIISPNVSSTHMYVAALFLTTFLDGRPSFLYCHPPFCLRLILLITLTNIMEFLLHHFTLDFLPSFLPWLPFLSSSLHLSLLYFLPWY